MISLFASRQAARKETLSSTRPVRFQTRSRRRRVRLALLAELENHRQSPITAPGAMLQRRQFVEGLSDAAVELISVGVNVSSRVRRDVGCRKGCGETLRVDKPSVPETVLSRNKSVSGDPQWGDDEPVV